MPRRAARRAALGDKPNYMIPVHLDRPGQVPARVLLGELPYRQVEALRSGRELRLCVLRLLMHYAEDSEDLTDAPLHADAVVITARAPHKPPQMIRSSLDAMIPRAMLDAGHLRVIT